MLLQEYPPRVRSVLEELGIPAELISARALPVHTEAHELVFSGGRGLTPQSRGTRARAARAPHCER